MFGLGFIDFVLLGLAISVVALVIGLIVGIVRKLRKEK